MTTANENNTKNTLEQNAVAGKSNFTRGFTALYTVCNSQQNEVFHEHKMMLVRSVALLIMT